MAALRGFLQLNTLGNIKTDSNGCVNCIIEGTNILKNLFNFVIRNNIQRIPFNWT